MDDGKVDAVLNIKDVLSRQTSGPKTLLEMTNHFLHVTVLLKETTGQFCNLITSLIFSLAIHM